MVVQTILHGVFIQKYYFNIIKDGNSNYSWREMKKSDKSKFGEKFRDESQVSTKWKLVN